MKPVMIQDWCSLVGVLNQHFLGLWILVAVDDTCAVDPVNTVHHEMDSVVRSYHFYKSV